MINLIIQIGLCGSPWWKIFSPSKICQILLIVRKSNPKIFLIRNEIRWTKKQLPRLGNGLTHSHVTMWQMKQMPIIFGRNWNQFLNKKTVGNKNFLLKKLVNMKLNEWTLMIDHLNVFRVLLISWLLWKWLWMMRCKYLCCCVYYQTIGKLLLWLSTTLFRMVHCLWSL